MSFPLLKLPLLAIRIVVDCWNPFELFNFSLNSTKCKRIATAFCKKARSIHLENWNELSCLVVFDTHISHWKFVLTSGNPKPYEDTYPFRKRAYQVEDPYTDVLYVIKILMEIFKVRDVTFELHDDEQFTMYEKLVIFCGLSSFHIGYGTFHYKCPESIQVFFEIYRAPTCIIELKTEGTFELPKLKKIDCIRYSRIACTGSHNFLLPNYIDPSIMEIRCDESVKSEHLNKFLKDWVSGENHSRLMIAEIILDIKIGLNEVLDGISRIETRVIRKYEWLDDGFYWIEEEADIHGPNGKTATVQTVCFIFEYEEEPWHPKYYNLVETDGEECRRVRVDVFTNQI